LTSERRDRLKALIADAFELSDGTYGYRRIHAQLARWGVPCGPELVRGIMRELDLQPCQPRPWRFNLTEQDGHEHHIPVGRLVRIATDEGPRRTTRAQDWGLRRARRRARRRPGIGALLPRRRARLRLLQPLPRAGHAVGGRPRL
jgi:hypothetical protein